jgi:hypothetical protein
MEIGMTELLTEGWATATPPTADVTDTAGLESAPSDPQHSR